MGLLCTSKQRGGGGTGKGGTPGSLKAQPPKVAIVSMHTRKLINLCEKSSDSPHPISPQVHDVHEVIFHEQRMSVVFVRQGIS